MAAVCFNLFVVDHSVPKKYSIFYPFSFCCYHMHWLESALSHNLHDWYSPIQTTHQINFRLQYTLEPRCLQNIDDGAVVNVDFRLPGLLVQSRLRSGCNFVSPRFLISNPLLERPSSPQAHSREYRVSCSDKPT